MAKKANKQLPQKTCTAQNYKNKEKTDTFGQLKILNYNCRGLASEARLVEMEAALAKVEWDIIGLSEVKRKGEGLFLRKSGNYFYFFGETPGQKGVGFLFKKEIWNKIQEIKSINERIAVAKMVVGDDAVLTIIQCYAPTAGAEEKAKEDFYARLQETLDAEKEKMVIVMGDLNGKVGINEIEEPCVGKFGLGDRNPEGERIIEFARTNNLKIANTFFWKRAERRWTWISPNGDSKNEIDYCLTDAGLVVKDYSIISKFEFSSDHRLGRCVIKVPHR